MAPPRYPAETPTRTARTVASAPTASAITSEPPGAPDELREDVLPVGRRAEQVLPGRRRALGGNSFARRVVGRDLAREDRRPRRRRASGATPTTAFRLRLTARQMSPSGRTAPPRPSAQGRPAASRRWSVAPTERGAHRMSRVRGSSSTVADVGGEDRGQHRDDDQQEEPLHEGVVLVLDRLQEHPADARVVEDVLDEDRAGDDEAERHREPGQVRAGSRYAPA